MCSLMLLVPLTDESRAYAGFNDSSQVQKLIERGAGMQSCCPFYRHSFHHFCRYLLRGIVRL